MKFQNSRPDFAAIRRSIDALERELVTLDSLGMSGAALDVNNAIETLLTEIGEKRSPDYEASLLSSLKKLSALSG